MTEEFKKELTSLLNRYGYDNACETPDHILADYIEKCLENYCATIQLNIAWHGSSWKRLEGEVSECLKKKKQHRNMKKMQNVSK